MNHDTVAELNNTYNAEQGYTSSNTKQTKVRPFNLSTPAIDQTKRILLQVLRFVRSQNIPQDWSTERTNLNSLAVEVQSTPPAPVSTTIIQENSGGTGNAIAALRDFVIAESQKKNIDAQKCSICELQYSKKQLFDLTNGLCPHKVCSICSFNYLSYNLNTYLPLACPSINCRVAISPQTECYKCMPRQLIKKGQLMKQIGDPGLKKQRICINPNCSNGTVDIQSPQLVCNHCSKQYCKECLYYLHAGPCTYFQQSMLTNNYKYKPCSKCKNLFQRSYLFKKPWTVCSSCKTKLCMECGQIWVLDRCTTGRDENEQRTVSHDDENSQYRASLNRFCSRTKQILLVSLFAICGMILVILNIGVMAITLLAGAVLIGPFYLACNSCNELHGCGLVLFIVLYPFFAVIGMVVYMIVTYKELEEFSIISWYFDTLDNLYNS